MIEGISDYGLQSKTKDGLLLLYVEGHRGSPKVTVVDCSKYSWKQITAVLASHPAVSPLCPVLCRQVNICITSLSLPCPAVQEPGAIQAGSSHKAPLCLQHPSGRKEKPKTLCCQEVRAAADQRTWLLSPQPFWKPGPEPEAENTTPEPLASLTMENMSQEAVFRKYCLGIWEALQLVK